MQQTNPYLQEIVRLNTIINALVESNQQLRRQISTYLKQPTTNSSMEEMARKYSNHELMGGEITTDALHPQAKLGDKVRDGTPPNSSTVENFLSNISNLGLEGGDLYDASLLPLTMLGGTSDAPNAYPSNLTPNTTANAAEASSAPASREIKEVNQQVLCSLLRKEMKTCTHGSINTAATLLIYFEPAGVHSYKDMRQVTGLSEDGLYKHLAMLIKRKLVVRKGYRKFELTQKALEMLEAARQ